MTESPSHRKPLHLFALLALLVTVLLSVPVLPARAGLAAAAVPGNWCVAGSFQGWDNGSTPLNDNGVTGDLTADDGVFSRDVTIPSAGRHEWKIVECGNWDNAYPAQNAWLNTNAANQVVKFTFDVNDYSGDAGATLRPTQNIVNAWDDLPGSFTAVGDFQGWNNNDPATLMNHVGQGIYRLAYNIPSPGSYIGKVTTTGSWDAFGADGRSVDAANLNFTTTASNQTVIFLLDTKVGRLTITPNGSGSGNWCLAGGFQGWNNESHSLNDNGVNGDLIGGDGVYSLDYAIPNAGREEWKIVECGNWDNAYPADNAWVLTSAADQVVKFTFDTNDHSNDAGLPLRPAQNIVNAWDDLPANFTAVGDFQGWNNANPATAMTHLGNNWFRLNYAVATPGFYEGKITETGNWDNQVGPDGRNRNAPTVNFQVFTAGDIIQVWLDGNQGRMAIIAPSAGGAGHDNNIFWDDLGHDSRDPLYRTPGGPVTTGTAVTLRLRAASNDLTAARVRVWNDRINTSTLYDMTLAADDGTYEWWEVTLPPSVEPTIYWYRFIAIDGTATAFYEDDGDRTGGWGQTFGSSPDNSWQLTIYHPGFQTPDWAKNAIIYQIFPDRFRDGNPANNPPAGRFFYGEADGTVVRSLTDEWNTAVCDPRAAGPCAGTYSRNFYGGDLQGIIDKLDYLQELGVTAIYLNPIFESPSNHKYDTADFGHISADFGDLATFQTLVTQAGSRGIRIILDGVFNHTSSDSRYFDRYSRYDAAGNLTSPGGPGVNDGSGACESQNSPYRDWFYFTDVTPGTGPCVSSTGVANAATYESWFGFDSLPKLNASNQEVRDYIWSGGSSAIGFYWPDQGADGWRFDVGGDVDPGVTNDPTNDYWEGFRSTVRSAFPDTYLVIEEWGNASPWVLGEEMDATMNYQYSSAVLSFWRDTPFEDNDHNSGSSAGILTPLTPSQLDERLQNWAERYPPEAYYAMMNLLGSHDTNRPLFFLDHNAADGTDTTPLLDPAYDWSDAMTRLKGVVILQMTLPGAPTIYYGDEVGLVGPTYYYGGRWEDDPYNRQPFPWLDESGTPFYLHLRTEEGQDQLRDHYKLLTAARNSHEALRTGSFDTLLVDDTNRVYAYGRKLADHSDAAVVILNRAGTVAAPVDQTVVVDIAGYLPYGASFTDALSGESYTVDGSGLLTVDVPGQSGVVLLLDAPVADPPAAVTDLAVTDERSGEVDLGWSAAAGATSYDVYRSLVSGGGYTFVANTAGTTYTDTGLQNAAAYYYVVVSRDDTTGLTSGNSNEAQAIPRYDLGTAWYNLQYPPETTHIISTVNLTEAIYGQLWIDGATGPNGPAAGIRAQIGYAPVGTSPGNPDEWTWVEMAYIGPGGFAPNNDEYAGNLLPDALGDYHYITRWSSDNGRSWYISDLGGPGDNGQPGLMHVVTSGDLEPPATPTNLTLEGTTATSISLSWDANSEGDLAGYELYRENVAAPGYNRIARVDTAVTSYTDESITTGETYNYYVIAFDTSFNRSDPSNTIEATAEPRLVTVTFTVSVPAYTPGTVYLVGDIPELGPWNPGLQPMTQVNDTTWTHTMEILDGTQLQYKYTRGSWDMVESWGSIVGLTNRHVTLEYGTDGTQLVDNTATDWGNGPDDNKAVQYWRDPIVVSHTPAADATDVPVNTTVTVAWSIPMAPDTTFTVQGPDGAVAGTFAYDSGTQTVTFTPAADLKQGTTYTVTVTGALSVGVPGGDSGVQQVPVTWSFTTFAPEPPTPQEQIDQLIADVQALVANGELTAQRANQLLIHLNHAKNFLNQGLEQPAIAQLNVFITKVGNFVRQGHLSAAAGQALIEDAEAIIAQINDTP